MAHTLIEQTPTNLFFPNPKADDESYLIGFKLSRAELDWVRTTPPESRQFLIKHDQDSVIARLDLSAMPDLVKVLSGTPERVEEMESLMARYGSQATCVFDLRAVAEPAAKKAMTPIASTAIEAAASAATVPAAPTAAAPEAPVIPQGPRSSRGNRNGD